MSDAAPVSRRSFFHQASLGFGAGVVGVGQTAAASEQTEARPAAAASARPPREVWVASICQDKLTADSPAQMIRKMLGRMEEVLPMQPDVICTPEVFHRANVSNRSESSELFAEQAIGPISQPFADFARSHQTNVICSIYTEEKGRLYNTSVVIDRQGQYVAEYRKINPTESELARGVTPGPLDPPVFDLDFGRIGIQICFDVNWHDNWRRLRDKGAEIVFWPSAFPGGQMLNSLASINKFYVVSSTRIQESKIVNPLGRDVVSTGRFGRWVCAPINLDAAVIQSHENIGKLRTVREKYGRDVNVTVEHDEAWALLECSSPRVSVKEILAEFGIETSNQFLARNESLQSAKRPS